MWSRNGCGSSVLQSRPRQRTSNIEWASWAIWFASNAGRGPRVEAGYRWPGGGGSTCVAAHHCMHAHVPRLNYRYRYLCCTPSLPASFAFIETLDIAQSSPLLPSMLDLPKHLPSLAAAPSSCPRILPLPPPRPLPSSSSAVPAVPFQPVTPSTHHPPASAAQPAQYVSTRRSNHRSRPPPAPDKDGQRSIIFAFASLLLAAQPTPLPRLHPVHPIHRHPGPTSTPRGALLLLRPPCVPPPYESDPVAKPMRLNICVDP